MVEKIRATLVGIARVGKRRQILLEELENFLLNAVGLSQSRDTGLGEDLELGQVGSGLTVVGCRDGVLRGCEVDLLSAGYRGGRGELVDVGTERATLEGDGADGVGDLLRRSRRVCRSNRCESAAEVCAVSNVDSDRGLYKAVPRPVRQRTNGCSVGDGYRGAGYGGR